MRRLRRIQERNKKAAARKLRRRAVAAGAAAAITLAAGASLQSAHAATDPHQLTLAADADADLLADREEIALGYMPFNNDQNHNTICDGAELAVRCAKAIEQLPWQDQVTDPGQTYRWCTFQYGLETCDICGESVNMGNAGIVNPVLGINVDCPPIAVHCMAHGSFDYAGHYSDQPLHLGRINIPLLARALNVRFPVDPNDHRLPLDGNDLDADLLTDFEELAAGFDLYEADQDNDLTPDGIELAAQCAAAIDALPVHDPYSSQTPPDRIHKICYFQKGLEYCEICAKSVNMGYWLVVNPQLDLSVEVPEIVCHYMTHGSFSYYGNVHGKGRIDLPLLLKVLDMPRKCGDLGALYLPGDLNKDCKEDFSDLVDLAGKWLDSTDPAQSAETEPQMSYEVRPCDAQTPPAK